MTIMLSRLEIWNLWFIQLESVIVICLNELQLLACWNKLMTATNRSWWRTLIATFFFVRITMSAMKLCMHKTDQPTLKIYKININYKYERIITVYYNMRTRFLERSCINILYICLKQRIENVHLRFYPAKKKTGINIMQTVLI